ncbi:MAG: hypothetical protein RLZZ381_1214 [Cyanobacteriota bacterium]
MIQIETGYNSEVASAVQELYQGYEQVSVYQANKSGTMNVIEAVSPSEILTQMQLWFNGKLVHATDYYEEEYSIEDFLAEALEMILNR